MGVFARKSVGCRELDPCALLFQEAAQAYKAGALQQFRRRVMTHVIDHHLNAQVGHLFRQFRCILQINQQLQMPALGSNFVHQRAHGTQARSTGIEGIDSRSACPQAMPTVNLLFAGLRENHSDSA